jgi:hypothetical protein
VTPSGSPLNHSHLPSPFLPSFSSFYIPLSFHNCLGCYKNCDQPVRVDLLISVLFAVITDRHHRISTFPVKSSVRTPLSLHLHPSLFSLSIYIRREIRVYLFASQTRATSSQRAYRLISGTPLPQFNLTMKVKSQAHMFFDQFTHTPHIIVSSPS